MSSRLPPPSGAPPSYAFVTRVYRSSLRPVVLFTTFFSGLWTLFSAIGFFRSISVDNDNNVHKLATFATVLGIMYITVFAIELFGFFSAAMQRLPLIRIYALLSVLATAVFIASEVTSVVVHFILKSDILNECTSLATGSTVFVYPFGFFGPEYSDNLTQAQAQNWCQSVYNNQSWSGIISMLITSLLALLFLAVTFAYYRQVLDPTSPANATRAPSNQVRTGGAFPSHYNPAYNAPNLGYEYNTAYGGPVYAPPPGAPPAQRDAPFAPPYDNDSKPPGYVGGDGKAGYSSDGKETDPFSDFDGPSRASEEEHDVTSRPAPGGRDTFR